MKKIITLFVAMLILSVSVIAHHTFDNKWVKNDDGDYDEDNPNPYILYGKKPLTKFVYKGKDHGIAKPVFDDDKDDWYFSNEDKIFFRTKDYYTPFKTYKPSGSYGITVKITRQTFFVKKAKTHSIVINKK